MPIKHSKMRTSDKIEYWVDIADYDIKTARSMHEAGKYLYSVFMCQQGMEKVLKAIYLKKFSNEAPFFSQSYLFAGPAGSWLAS